MAFSVSYRYSLDSSDFTKQVGKMVSSLTHLKSAMQNVSNFNIGNNIGKNISNNMQKSINNTKSLIKKYTDDTLINNSSKMDWDNLKQQEKVSDLVKKHKEKSIEELSNMDWKRQEAREKAADLQIKQQEKISALVKKHEEKSIEELSNMDWANLKQKEKAADLQRKQQEKAIDLQRKQQEKVLKYQRTFRALSQQESGAIFSSGFIGVKKDDNVVKALEAKYDNKEVFNKAIEREYEHRQQRMAVSYIRGGMLATQFGQMATIGLTAPIVAMGALGTKFYAENERFQATLKAFLGGNEKLAKKYYGEIFSFAAKTPFEFEESRVVARQIMGAMSDVDRFSNKGVSILTTKFDQLGTLATLFNKSIVDVSTIYSKVAAGDRMTARELTSFVRRGINFQQFAAEALMLKKPGVYQSIKAAKIAIKEGISKGQFDLATFDFVLKYIKDKYPKLMDDIQSTLSTRWEAFKDYTLGISAIFAESGIRLYRVKDILGGINNKLEDMVKRASNGEKIFSGWNVLALSLLAGVGPLSMGLGRVLDMMGNFSLMMIGLKNFKATGLLNAVSVFSKILMILTATLAVTQAIDFAFKAFIPVGYFEKNTTQFKKTAKFMDKIVEIGKKAITFSAGFGVLFALIGGLFGGGVPGAIAGFKFGTMIGGLIGTNIELEKQFGLLKKILSMSKLVIKIAFDFVMPNWLQTFFNNKPQLDSIMSKNPLLPLNLSTVGSKIISNDPFSQISKLANRDKWTEYSFPKNTISFPEKSPIKIALSINTNEKLNVKLDSESDKNILLNVGGYTNPFGVGGDY